MSSGERCIGREASALLKVERDLRLSDKQNETLEQLEKSTVCDVML